jgi:hypothetical protein
MPTDRPLIMTVERFLRETGLAATTFGRLAMRDPRFVLDLRVGRQPGSSVRCKVEHFMNKWRAEQAALTDQRDVA